MMGVFRKRGKVSDPMGNVMDSHFWLQYQILAMSLGMTRRDWEKVKVELERARSTGDGVSDSMFAARMTGVDVSAPGDWGTEPWDARSARKDADNAQ